MCDSWSLKFGGHALYLCGVNFLYHLIQEIPCIFKRCSQVYGQLRIR